MSDFGKQSSLPGSEAAMLTPASSDPFGKYDPEAKAKVVKPLSRTIMRMTIFARRCTDSTSYASI